MATITNFTVTQMVTKSVVNYYVIRLVKLVLSVLKTKKQTARAIFHWVK